MKYPRIMAEINRTQWAITQSGLDAIISAAESDVSPDDYRFFHQVDQETRETLAQSFGPRLAGTRSAFINGAVGVLSIEGPIIARSTPLSDSSGVASFDAMTKDFKALAAAGVERIVLVIDSPGGSVTGTSEFAQLIASSEIKTSAFVVGVAASAAYWVASATDEIVAVDTGAVGSIGVLIRSGSQDDDDGVITVSSRAPDKRPDMDTEDGRASVQRVADQLEDVFVEAVASGRGVSTDKVVADFGRGGVLVAKAAMAAGMIDRIESFETFIGRATGAIGGSDLISLAKTETEPASIAGEREGPKMDLTQFLAENPAAAVELQAKLAAEFERGKAEARTDVSAASKFLGTEYPATIQALAASVIKGDEEGVNLTTLRIAAANHDEFSEKIASLEARLESNAIGSTAPPPEMSAIQNEIAEANAIRKLQGFKPLSLEV